MAASRRLRIAGLVVGVLAVAIIVGVAGIVIVLSQYVTTESADEKTAALAFSAAGEHLTGRSPLIEYHDVPVVHRDDASPRRTLGTFNVLVYDADEGELKRVAMPAHVLELITLGGRVRLANLEVFGDSRDRITLEDLERHGPGLVLDTSSGAVPQVAIANLLLGRKTRGTRLMVWTD